MDNIDKLLQSTKDLLNSLNVIESSFNLLKAIKDNCEPIEGTTGITQGDEVPTGSYIRQQYIAGEMEDLENSLREAKNPNILTNQDKEFIISSLNETFHSAYHKLHTTRLGDIEKVATQNTIANAQFLIEKLK